ncbi:hypothetical protein ACFL6C_11860 [Myxococcota bacterium]
MARTSALLALFLIGNSCVASDRDLDRGDESIDDGVGNGDSSLGDTIEVGECDLGSAPFIEPFHEFYDDNRARFVSEVGDLCVEIARNYVSRGAGQSAIYELVGFSYSRDGQLLCETDAALLDYTNTHHNWRDVAAMTRVNIRYELEIFFEWREDNKITLRTRDVESGEEIEGAVPLVPENP